VYIQAVLPFNTSLLLAVLAAVTNKVAAVVLAVIAHQLQANHLVEVHLQKIPKHLTRVLTQLL
jgi:hypothetical protein